MTTEYVVLNEETPDPAVIERAGQIIKNGGLVAFPTETVYGLGGDALNPASSKKIYAAKGRPSDNPLIVHVCRFEDIGRAACRGVLARPSHHDLSQERSRARRDNGRP